MSYVIQLKNVTKRFSTVVANDHISIDIEKGEIHTLAGENGAGKTTLMNILYGLYQPDEGEIWINGAPVRLSSSKDSIAHKIGMVHQHFLLVPKLTVTENIMAGQEIGSPLRIDRKKASKQIRELSEKFGLLIDPDAKVSTLTVAQQQRVEILKILYRQAEILIFDEPTAVLAPQEIDEFCSILFSLKKAGKTIIFISHKLAEVMKISDRITIIRHGKVITTVSKKDTNPEELTRVMVGRDVNLGRRGRPACAEDKVLIESRDIRYFSKKKSKTLQNVDFKLYSGEILGFAGVDGNGQEELVQILCGLVRPESGSILFKGSDITADKIRKRIESGLGTIPEDRHRDGLVLDFSIAENLILGVHYKKPFTKRTILQLKQIKGYAQKLRQRFDVRCPDETVKVGTLSGGNQQKVVIAREVAQNVDVLIAVQPTRGLDVGAVEFVQTTLLEERNKGKGILLFSLELDEILSMSDRVAVMYKGAIVDIIDAAATTRQELGLMMLSGTAEKGGRNSHETG